MPYKVIKKAGKSRKTCLTNRTRSILHHIMPLVINGLGGGHTDTHAYRHADQNNFKKPGMRGLPPCAPGLKRGIEIESKKLWKQVRHQGYKLKNGNKLKMKLKIYYM